MSANPVSIRDDATVREAVDLLTERGYGAAPVIDAAGRPVGVLSQSDLLIHDRERVDHVPTMAEYYQHADLTMRHGAAYEDGFQVENVDPTLVSEVMTPLVFSVTPETPAAQVIAEMLALKVHRLFVVDHGGVLAGVITATDVLRRLVPAPFPRRSL
jgi:CBS domain-containing protein